jgi:hypothetical protein
MQLYSMPDGQRAFRRVMLVDAPQHSEKLVVKVIPVVVPGTTEDHARNCFHTSRQLGQVGLPLHCAFV